MQAEFGISSLEKVNSRVRIENKLSESIEEGQRQGDPLAKLLFILVLEAAVRAAPAAPFSPNPARCLVSQTTRI